MANIQDLLFNCNSAITNITKITEKEFNENTDGSLSWNEWQQTLKENNVKDSFYLNAEGKTRLVNYLFYVDFELGIYVPLLTPVFCKQLIDFQFTDDSFASIPMQIKSLEHHQKSCVKNNDWHMFYIGVPTTFVLLDFNKRYKQIPDNQLIEIFKSVYCNIDYNCNYIDKQALLKIKSLNSKSKRNRIITIYRGQGELSPNLDSIYSWTTSKEIALKFALMRKNPRCIYSAKIAEDNIIAKINNRDEKEIIALPEDIFDVKTIDFDETSKDIVTNIVSEYQYDYIYYKDVFEHLKKLGFASSTADHTLSHSARVLFYSIMLADDFDLSEEERTILAYCATYHDLGRDNDVEDSVHGKKSLDVIKNSKLNTFGLEDEDLVIADTIIEYHCKHDETGINKINSLKNIRNKSKATKLYKIFKDLDALDRVRFLGTDLDVRFFRFSKVKRKLLVAASLNYYRVDGLLLI